jgi:cytochrome c oxidase subunit I+III
MFTVGIPLLALAFFSAASMAVAIPMGIQVFAWIATLWAGRPWLRVPTLYLFGFFFVFVPGGLTGVMVAMVPFDWQAHDSHFVVAHLHHVLIGGLMFPLFAGLYYWLPLASGREPSESLSRTAFWLVFIGFNLTFLPMYLTGLLGMPRRGYTYLPELGLHWPNLVSTAAGFVLAVGMVAVLMDVALSFRHGLRARRNPWRAGTLEWALEHPVPDFNFASVPRVQGRDPLWADPRLAEATLRPDGLLGEARHGVRELIGSSILDARPEQVIRISGPTWLPLLAALVLAALLAAFIAGLYWLAAAIALPLLALLWRWAWTTGDPGGPDAVEAEPGLVLPTQYAARNAPGWWALVMSLLVDGSLFASLVFSCFYLWLGAEAWPPDGVGIGIADWPASLAALGVLLACAAATRFAVRALQQGALATAARGWVSAALLGAVFIAAHARAMAPTGAPGNHAYASVAWTLAGFHAAHVALAMLFALFVAARLRQGLVSAARPLEARITAALWRYTVAQGVFAWSVLHLFPRLA